jgi:hypothetical protein
VAGNIVELRDWLVVKDLTCSRMLGIPPGLLYNTQQGVRVNAGLVTARLGHIIVVYGTGQFSMPILSKLPDNI